MPSEAVVTTLENLQTALDDQAFAEAERLLADLGDAYGTMRGEEAALERKAIAVRDRVEPLDGGIPDELSAFVTTGSATSMGRGGVLWGTKQYLLDPTEGGVDSLKQQVGDLKEQEETFLEAEIALQSTLDTVDVDLPAILVVSRAQLPDGPYIPGHGYEFTAAALNVGDTPAESVSLRVETPDGVSVSRSSADVGTLEPDQEAVRTFTVEADGPGGYNVGGVVESADGDVGSDSNTAQFTVVGADDLSEQALEAVRRTETRLKDSDLKKGEAKSLLSKLTAAEKKIEHGRSHLDRGNEQRADNQFEAATRILGAFLNERNSNGKPSRSVDDTTHTVLENLTNTAIDQLALAQRA